MFGPSAKSRRNLFYVNGAAYSGVILYYIFDFHSPHRLAALGWSVLFLFFTVISTFLYTWVDIVLRMTYQHRYDDHDDDDAPAEAIGTMALVAMGQPADVHGTGHSSSDTNQALDMKINPLSTCI